MCNLVPQCRRAHSDPGQAQPLTVPTALALGLWCESVAVTWACVDKQVFSRSECDRMLVREEKRAAALKRDAYQVQSASAPLLTRATSCA